MDPSNNLVYDEAKAYAWLRYAYAEACKCGVALAPASVSPGLYSVSTYVLELAAEISSIAWRYLPLLLVDGYDEVPVEQAVTISRAILDHFLTDCTRLILGIRDPIIPRTYVIKSSENHLKLMDIKINPEDHFVRFKTCFYPNAVHLDVVNLSQWQSTIAGYNWQHPYINAFLFDRALSANPANFPNLLTPNEDRKSVV